MLYAHDMDILETDRVPDFSPPALEMLDDPKVNILLVEDVASDALLLRIALKVSNIPFRLSCVQRGDQLLSGIRSYHHLCPEQMPDVIMLDLGLPGVDGFNILDEMSCMSSAVRSIPIVILTGHKHFEYISKNYPYLWIIAYVNKPCDASEIKKLLEFVQSWKNHLKTGTLTEETGLPLSGKGKGKLG